MKDDKLYFAFVFLFVLSSNYSFLSTLMKKKTEEKTLHLVQCKLTVASITTEQTFVLTMRKTKTQISSFSSFLMPQRHRCQRQLYTKVREIEFVVMLCHALSTEKQQITNTIK